MLDPYDRTRLLEALQAPEGYDLSDAIGTTYSLDLMTLLTVPLAFAMAEGAEEDARNPNPLALLEAVRRHADKTHIFCQAGAIYPPGSKHRIFLSYLEGAVHEVTSPRGGVFHPKVWVLRFAQRDEEQCMFYRVLISSRNLTFDRSWDTMLVLEGEALDRVTEHRHCRPLGDFIEALPRLMLHRPTRSLRKVIRTVAHELRRVDFEYPEGFDELAFHPIGLTRHDEWQFAGRLGRLLVVSPFVDAGFLNVLDIGGDDVLISRRDTLDQLPETMLGDFRDAYYLSPDADPGNEEDPSSETANFSEVLSGLHAKLFVADDGWNARVWTGSANATGAAFSKNVEFLAELTGKKRLCGVDTLLPPDMNPGDPESVSFESGKVQPKKKNGTAGIADLLHRYERDEHPSKDPAEAKVDLWKRKIRTAIYSARFEGSVSASGDGQAYEVDLSANRKLRFSKNVQIDLSVWPVTLQSEASRKMLPGKDHTVSFDGISFEALTSFFVFSVEADAEGFSFEDMFVLNIPMSGMPQNRSERILRSQLGNKGKVLQFLLFLLADDGDPRYLAGDIERSGDPAAGAYSWPSRDADLLEMLLQALHVDPVKIERIASVVEVLGEEDRLEDPLPDRFMEIWKPVWTAYQEAYK